jgi:hypothetical protein
MSQPIELDRLLRRFLAGACPQSVLAHALECAIDQLAAAGGALAARGGELRRVAPAALAAYEQAVEASWRLLFAERFVAVRDELRRGGQAVRTLTRALEALDDQLSAARDLESLIVENGLEPLRSLPVLRIPARLLDRARELLQGGEHRKAAFQARLARRLASRLAARASEPAPDLMAGLERLAADLRTLAAGDPELVGAVRRLAEQGHIYLARWLAEDLEQRLLGRYRRRRAGNGDTAQTSPAALAASLVDTATRSVELSRRLAAWARD